jgi:N6-L-threonylcarbamoyladenine synthase
MTKDSYILGIETSCDETAASVVKNGTEIISNVVASQITSQKRFGGVVPEIASRHHVEVL